MCVSFSLNRRFFSASSPRRFRMIRLWCEQADGHTFKMRFTFRNITVTGVSAMTLTFSLEPIAQAYAAAKVCPSPALERILRFPQMSSCMTSTVPDRTRPIESAVSPARRTKAPFGKTLFSALRQESITVSSSSEMPENSGAERITEKNSFIKIFFSLKFNRLVDLIIL